MAVIFFILIAPLCVCASTPYLHKKALFLNKVWCQFFFILIMIPIKTKWHFKPEKNQQYILCANHFSYLDIMAMGLFPKTFKFVGKIQLANIPLFGYMYNRVHITVDRASIRSRGKTFLKAQEALKEGYGLGIFPEGGILSKKIPEMVNFKDGAFRMAAETNTPIVPIVFPDNYKILRGDDFMNIRYSTCRIIYHQPIFAKGADEAAIKELKEEVFRVIQSELDKTADYTKTQLV